MWPLFRSRLDLTPFCQDHISSLSGELLGENLEPDAPFTGSDSSVPWGSPASGCFLFSLLLCRWHRHSANAKSSGCISSSGEGMKAQDGGSKAWKKSKMFLQLNVCYLNSLKKKHWLSSYSISYSLKIGLDQWKSTIGSWRQQKQRRYFADKGPSGQSYGFSSSHVQMWELDHKEGWALKNWCFRIVVLEKTLESPLDCKEINQVNPKGHQPWTFIGRTDAEAEAPTLWQPDAKSQLIGKDSDAE